MRNSVWCRNYETWRWEDFDLAALESGAVVLFLVEGDYWIEYTKTGPDAWVSNDEDMGEIDDETLVWETLSERRDSWVIIAPRGLVGNRVES